MKIIISSLMTILLIGLLACSPTVRDERENLEVRLVIEQHKSENIPFEKFPYTSNKQLFVSKRAILTNRDYCDAVITRTKNIKVPANFFPLIKIKLKESAAKRFEKFTSDNIERQIAVIYGKKVLMAPFIMGVIPKQYGKIVISCREIANDDEAVEFVKKMGFTPKFEYESESEK